MNTVESGRPYGIWSTTAFAVLLVVIYILAIFISFFVFAILELVNQQGLTQDELALRLGGNTDYLLMASIMAALAALFTTLYLCRRARDITTTEYLKLYPPGIRALLLGHMMLALFIIAEMFTLGLLGDRSGEAFARQTMEATQNPALVWIFVLLVAPIFEEVVFRGFLLEGLRHSRLGNMGAVLITALLWALVHTQYNALLMLFVFLLGVLLGYARLRSNSLYLVIMMHTANNLVSSLQVST